MPLLIYVSDGKLLPQVFDDEFINGEESIKVGKWAKNPSFISRLQTSSLFKRKHKQAAIAGIQNWQWAANEHILSFVFTNQPAKADILVFWCEKLKDHTGWAYHPPLVKGEAYPVIIMISLEKCKGSDSDFYCKSMQKTMTHEFGHAIGLDHSPYEGTLMFAKYSGPITAADKASVRAFYSLPGDIIFPSVSKK